MTTFYWIVVFWCICAIVIIKALPTKKWNTYPIVGTTEDKFIVIKNGVPIGEIAAKDLLEMPMRDFREFCNEHERHGLDVLYVPSRDNLEGK